MHYGTSLVRVGDQLIQETEDSRAIMKEEPEFQDRPVNPSGSRQRAHPPAVHDWRPADWDWDRGLSIGLLVYESYLLGETEGFHSIGEEIAQELQELTAAERVHHSHIDPSVGAGTSGVAFLLQLLDVGADIVTLAVVAPVVKRKITAAMAHLYHRLSDDSLPARVALTADALQVLVMDEVCSRNKIDPYSVVRLECSSHEIDPPEPAMELKQLYSAHTVTVEAVREDGYHHVWVYTVSPTGRVLAESHVHVPIPNGTRWGWPIRETARFLDGLRPGGHSSTVE